MALAFVEGAKLTGCASLYTIVKELHRAPDNLGTVYLAERLGGESVVVKRSNNGRRRLQNEADILGRYRNRPGLLRALKDEISSPADPPSIVLQYMDSDALAESNRKRFSRPEYKQVARSILEALRALHGDGLVHTGVRLDNIFVNLGSGDERFRDVRLGGCGGVVPQEVAKKEGHVISGDFTRSPEALFKLPLTTATDIWSFGTTLTSLVLGGGYHLFDPQVFGVKPGEVLYDFTALKRIHRIFGPFPESYHDFKNPTTSRIVDFVNKQGPPEKPFAEADPGEFPPADRDFILKIMKLDPHARPTAEQLLADPWFTEESPDTRHLLPQDLERERKRAKEKRKRERKREAARKQEEEERARLREERLARQREDEERERQREYEERERQQEERARQREKRLARRREEEVTRQREYEERERRREEREKQQEQYRRLTAERLQQTEDEKKRREQYELWRAQMRGFRELAETPEKDARAEPQGEHERAKQQKEP